MMTLDQGEWSMIQSVSVIHCPIEDLKQAIKQKYPYKIPSIFLILFSCPSQSVHLP